METLGFLGGTGPLGRGLGLRLAQAGHRVLVGSRRIERAAEAADKILAKDADVEVVGVENAEAASADIVVVSVPYEAQRPTLESHAQALDDKVVVCCVNALGFDKTGPYPVRVDEGSAAEEAQAILPSARVVGAFQNVSAKTLLAVPGDVDADVLITGDDADARAAVAALAERIPGMRAFDAGLLRLTRPVEELTAVLIAVNKRYKAHSSIRLTNV